MNSLHLRLEFLTDVAITERSATVGGHRSLGYVPGATLLGAAAATAWKTLAADVAVRVFHSDRVRFGCALPADGDRPAVPAPLSLHYPKGGSDRGEHGRLSGEVRNFARLDGRSPEEWGGRQPKQIRGGFLARDLRLVEPDRAYSMRTAIGAKDRARDGFLFGLEAIRAGTVMYARIDADEASDLDAVRSALVGREVRLGRSRSAEFGGVAVTEAEAWSDETGDPRKGSAVFLCLSDLALRGSGGQPSLRPDPAAFGLPDGWKFGAERSFLRVRRYSPFNAKRRRSDLERQVIVAGSVIVFEGPGVPHAGAVRKATSRGVGEWRRDGLGQVLWEPAVLSEVKPVPTGEPAALDSPAAAKPAPLPQDELGRWLASDLERTRREDRAWKTAMKWVDWWCKRPRNWRIRPAQWGEIRRMARAHQSARDGGGKLIEQLTTHLSKGVRRVAWAEEKGKRGDRKSANDALLGLIRTANEKAGDDTRIVPVAVELFAVHVVRRQKEVTP
ncbi:MAG: hypothetical protein QME96_09970 [Myxococcota bacterium]|nr:hypothetical protein [Myxococcota bacterium]